RGRALIDGGPPAVRGPAEAGYGRVMLARGDVEKAEPALRRALEADRAEGRLSDEMKDGSALLWALVALQQRFADARALLAELQPARDAYPEARAWYAMNEALLAAETNDLRVALAGYRSALRIAERLGAGTLATHAAEDLARILVLDCRVPP